MIAMSPIADGSQPKAKKRNPLLGLRFRYAVTEPDRAKVNVTG